MALVVLATDLLPFLELSADDSNSNVARVQVGVEQWVKNYCGRDFESTTYKEEIVRNDGYSIFVRNPPITKIHKVAVGSRTVMQITNTNAVSSAIVNVSSTEIILTFNGSDDASDLTFATNTTISAMVTAINAVGNGWVATAESGYESLKTTELLPRYGAEAIDNTTVYIKAPEQGISGFEVNANTGEIYREGGFYMGKVRSPQTLLDDGFYHDRSEYSVDSYIDTNSQKIYVNYVGGYLTIPSDLKLAVMEMVKFEYQKIEEESIGVSQYRAGDLSKTLDALPSTVKRILNSYRIMQI